MNGQFLGSIAGPQGLHGTFFGGRDKKTFFGHRLLRYVGYAERKKPDHRDSDDRRGL